MRLGAVKLPQGSILGPKIFVLYINDICNVSKLAKFILFADDTNIFCACNNLKELQGMINGVLAKFAKWFAVNKLTLNLSKTNYMIFWNCPPDIEINLFINTQQITRVHVTEFLGVYIDESLNWKYKINKVRLKLSKVAAVIYKALIEMECIYYTVLCFYHIYVIAVKCGETPTQQTFMALLYYRNE